MTDLNKKPSYMFPNEKRYGRAVPPKRKLNQQVFNVSSSRRPQLLNLHAWRDTDGRNLAPFDMAKTHHELQPSELVGNRTLANQQHAILWIQAPQKRGFDR